mmetsp:Transcript_29317/g.69072  ORF Transcript_29317/g.69072 Transcript_29317/m.69072 type:complete len:591 (-) Transcript_29317:218-1990(-)
MRALLLVSLCASAACLRTVALPASLRRAGVSLRTGVQLCEAEDDAVRPAAANSAQEIRLQAERLALKAEKAALEAEQLTLQAEQIKFATAQRRRETDASGATTPEPVPTESSAKPLDRDPWMADAAQRTDPAPKSESPAPIEASAGGIFNLSLAGPNGSAPLKGQLQQALEIRGLREPRELQLTAAQTALIKSEVFDIETFYTMKVEDSPVGTIFRGNLRADADVVFPRVQERLANASRSPQAEGLAGVQLLLIEDPLPLTLAQLEAGDEKRPVFLALGPKAAEMRQSPGDLVLAFVSLLACSFTVLGYALSSFILTDDGKLIEQLQNGDTEPLMLALPIALGVGGLQLLHEVGHLLAALRSNVKIGFPVAVPSLQLGLYGCVTRLFSFPPSRSALFDVAAAGPMAAGVASLAVYVVGLVLSFDLPPLPAEPGALYPVLPTALLQSSLLLGTMAEAILPDLTSSQIVQLHPLAVIGFTGALLNALQLLPVGRLDGGRLATAALGQGAAGIVSGIGLLLLGLQSIISGDNPILLYFGLLVIFFQRAPDLPTANEYTGLDLTRQIAAGSAFLFMLLTLLPCPVELVYPAVPL